MIRFFDIALSVFALILLLPLLLPIILILKFSGEGEVFFLQERVGINKKMFKLIKFATMLKNSPNIGTGTVTTKNDPRILPAGYFLRKTKINELPQLLNILLGQMSIIGPRPQTPRCFDAFPKSLQDVIVSVKPGLSGIGSVIFRGEEDMLVGDNNNLNFYDNEIAPYKALLEAWYVDNRSLKINFLLIFCTVHVVCFSKSNIVWKIFKDLPEPPDNLWLLLSYKNLYSNKK